MSGKWLSIRTRNTVFDKQYSCEHIQRALLLGYFFDKVVKIWSLNNCSKDEGALEPLFQWKTPIHNISSPFWFQLQLQLVLIVCLQLYQTNQMAFNAKCLKVYFCFKKMLHELLMSLLGNTGGLFELKIENNIERIKVCQIYFIIWTMTESSW